RDAMKIIAEVQAKGFEGTAVDPEQIRAAVEAATGQIVKLVERQLTARTAEMERLKAQAKPLLERLQKLIDADVSVSVSVRHNEPFTVTGAAAEPAPVAGAPVGPPAEGLTEPQQAILDTVRMLGARGIRASRDAVARWLGIHPKGGSYGTNLGRLRADGYLDGFALTEKGRAAARQTATGLEAALAALDEEPKRKIVRTLVDAGRPLSRDELAAALGIHPKGGSFGTNLGWLRTMGVITDRGPIAPTEGLRR
ncbi:MAG: hypothetical protein JWO31_1579, partial [Phycisphaerales bacterium]|nr:hypothetical protein [Phycisphaerales bacterium]